MQDTQDKPDVGERYATATNAKSLKIVADQGGPGDVLIAAGFAASALYRALTRLMVKPMPGDLDSAQMLICTQAQRWKMEKPMEISAAVLGWWIDQRCPDCKGTGYALGSGMRCVSCKGHSGQKPIPYGESGKKLAGHIEDCVVRGVGPVARRLYSSRQEK